MSKQPNEPSPAEPSATVQPPSDWLAWYRFARDELGYEHSERVEYANLRYVEERNRELLRRAGRDRGRAA